MERTFEGDATSVPEVSEKNRSGRLFSWSLAWNENDSPRIWRSRLSWRIVMAVFLTIMTVQASVLALTLKNYQAEQLFELKAHATSVVSSVMDHRAASKLESPISVQQQQRIFALTPIRGMTVYSTEYN